MIDINVNSNNQLISTWTTSILNQVPWYEYSMRFMLQNLFEIINEKWINWNDMMKENELTKWYDKGDILKYNILSKLDNNDLAKIQRVYLNQWKLLLNEIKTIKS